MSIGGNELSQTSKNLSGKAFEGSDGISGSSERNRAVGKPGGLPSYEPANSKARN